MKLIIGLILAVCVGIGCRWLDIPLPGPPAIMGAAMAVAMASGYTATDRWLARKSIDAATVSVTQSEQSIAQSSSATAGIGSSLQEVK
jgi:XapX domain-containing protein